MLACTHPAFDGPVILFQDVIKTLHGVTAKMQHFQEVSSSMIAALFLIETAKSELDAGLPQAAEAVSNGIRHSRRNHRENRACDWRSRPTFRINLTLETALSRRARSGWSPPTYLE
jgi:hypothetical protein